ncbi:MULTISPECIES: hypothetical protein [Sediminimonas]|uniref:Uncharacterized protein n=1 Tax=Sediminimonas qiaohouensis TaxID=552061 RepID=A0A7C9L7I0_9RHOB|nr:MULTISPECIES: hypothetical protein [Sediminimonas]MDR9485401.1 hypothetical protein [Sediminimonas sp.]MTJ04275.1 hypothetical protein [Sediminimonas qiaohouensis]
MLRLIKYLFYLALLGGIALVGYAYIGPFLGADFSAPKEDITQTVVLPLDTDSPGSSGGE